MAGISIDNLNLDAAEAPKLASAGFHRAQLVETGYEESKNTPGAYNFTFVFQLSDKDPDCPGRKMKAWLSAVTEHDQGQNYADGRTKIGAKLDWAKKVQQAFGGDGKGSYNKNLFTKYIGKFVDVQISHDPPNEAGDIFDRIDLAFGSGIKKVG